MKEPDRRRLKEINRKLAMLSFFANGLPEKDNEIIANRLFKERDKIIKKYDQE